jgi:hypothetical protein
MLEVAKLALEIAGWPGKLTGLKYCRFCAEAVSSVRAEAAAAEEELSTEEGEAV